MVKTTTRSLTMALAAGALLLASAPMSFADSAGATLSDSSMFTEKTGKELYDNVCAACHMANGEGAVGAGHYPALANNESIEEGSYPVFILLNGLKGMPAVGQMMNDDQIAAVVNYVRTNFGNNYKEPVTAQDVADSR